MEEKWVTIKIDGLESFIISNMGNIKHKEKVLSTFKRNGYDSIKLLNKNYFIHRLVAISFLENPDKKEMVNHKNGNKLDNRLVNLEWCTSKENTKHAIETKLLKPFIQKVHQFSYDGKTLIQTFSSIREAERITGVGNRLISQVCRKQKPTAHGFVWRYDNEVRDVQEEKIDGKEIPDYPNYLVTKDGEVFSKRSKKILIPNKNKEYDSIKLCNKGKMKDFYIHRLVAESYIPNISNGTHVKHINGDKRDNRSENLLWI